MYCIMVGFLSFASPNPPHDRPKTIICPASPDPKRVLGKSLENGTRRASQIPNERRQTRKRLASNTLGNRSSMNNWSGVACAKTFVGDGLENLSKPGEGTIQKTHYLTGGDGSLFAMYVIDQNNQGKMYYVNTDHLGSPNLITDAECNVVQELSYDAWGNRRDPATCCVFFACV